MFYFTFITVLESHIISVVQFALVDSLHHEQQLVVGDVFVVNGHAPDVVSQAGLDDQFPSQIHWQKVERATLFVRAHNTPQTTPRSSFLSYLTTVLSVRGVVALWHHTPPYDVTTGHMT